MIPEKDFVNIAKGLYDKTLKEHVDWEESKQASNTFLLALPQSLLVLSYKRPSTEPDFIDLRLYRDGDSQLAGFWRVEEGDEHWELMSALYSVVEKQITGWDKVLEDVYKFLGPHAGSKNS